MNGHKDSESQIFFKVQFQNLRVSKILIIFFQKLFKFLVVVCRFLVKNFCYAITITAHEDPQEVLLEEALSEFDYEKDQFESSEDEESLTIEENWSNLFGNVGLGINYGFEKKNS